MKKNLPAESLVMFPSMDSLNLYTGFQGIAGVTATNREEFLSKLRHERIAYLLLNGPAPAPHGAGNVYTHWRTFEANRQWVLSWPEMFPVLYANPSENTAVFKVRPSGESDRDSDRHIRKHDKIRRA
jgi:hypothetical protein